MPDDTGLPFELPFPEDADAPDGPSQIEALALAVDPILLRAGGQAKACSVPAEQARTNTAYGELGTPDRVEGLVVPDTNAIVEILYQAQWKESVHQASRAAIFLDDGGGAEQLRAIQRGGVAAITLAAYQGSDTGSVVNHYRPLLSNGFGLISVDDNQAAPIAEPDTGLVVPWVGLTPAIELGGSIVEDTSLTAVPKDGICFVRGLAAGTYAVSVQFKASSGSVTAKERLLRARVLTYES